MLVVIAPAVVAAGVESNEKWEPVRTIISFICQWAPPEKQEQQPAGLQEGVFRERERSPRTEAGPLLLLSLPTYTDGEKY